MSADVDVCNEALSAIGIAREIQDLAADSSAEAQACRRFFPRARDLVLRDFPWPRLKTVEALALVATEPNAQWGYSYRMPEKAVRIVRLQIDASPRRDTTTTRIPYELGRDDTGGLIYSDYTTDQGLSAKYVYNETAIDRWTADMVEVLALLLASKVAPRFGPDAAKLGLTQYQLYERRRQIAWAQAANEEAPDPEGDGDIVRSRDNFGWDPTSRSASR